MKKGSRCLWLSLMVLTLVTVTSACAQEDEHIEKVRRVLSATPLFDGHNHTGFRALLPDYPVAGHRIVEVGAQMTAGDYPLFVFHVDLAAEAFNNLTDLFRAEGIAVYGVGVARALGALAMLGLNSALLLFIDFALSHASAASVIVAIIAQGFCYNPANTKLR